MNNRQTLIFMAVVAALMGALALYQFFQPPRWNGSHISPPAPMPGFSLQSAAGAVDLQQFAGKYVILYFGYTGCPDVCPTTLAGLREALRRLGANADKFQVIFVSVDPARDTPQIASAYAARFNPASTADSTARADSSRRSTSATMRRCSSSGGTGRWILFIFAWVNFG